MPTTPEKRSKWIPGRYPAAGTSAVADAIRRRRGERGLTPLDGALLHVEPVAEGWNALLGAVRTKGGVPGDVREVMILRVAAVNGAAYEWIHHEGVGRECGLTTAQLCVIRDTAAPVLLPPFRQEMLSPLQRAALVFADESTREVGVSAGVVEGLRGELRKWVVEMMRIGEEGEEEVEKRMDDLFVECALVVASYNMVSRFLVAVDVAGSADDDVPWPLIRTEEFIPLPTAENPTHKIHTVTLKTSDSAPWIAFANSLLTDLQLWSLVVPYFIARGYNILLCSQRGHGKSTLPPPSSSSSSSNSVTIPSLASDIHLLLHRLNIPTPIKSLIGVSQGGAATLAFAAQYPNEVESIVACDTAARTPVGNNVAWEERIRLVNGDQLGGMKRLADVTVPRWFPPESKVSSEHQSGGGRRRSRAEWISNMIREMSVEGFEAGARALSSYDTLSLGVLDSPVENVLLLAGSLDGNGKVGSAMGKLGEEWNEKRRLGLQGQWRREVEFVLVEGSGHLPMVDEPEAFCEAVDRFLRSF